MKKLWKKIGCTALTVLTAVSMLQGNVPETFMADETEKLKIEGYENGNGLDLNKLGSYVTGTSNKDGGVCEIISYDSKNNKAWVVNGEKGLIDIIDLSNVTSATSSEMPATSIDVKKLVEGKVDGFTYGDMTSVSVHSELGYVAVALQEEAYDKNGYVAILKTDGTFAAMFEAGVQPDMVTFTPDGTKVLVANEGEPRNGYGNGVVDPCGSVTILSVNTNDISQSRVKTVGFEKFDISRDELVNAGVMLAKGINPSTDLEPEYITSTNEIAYVALQEANAIAVLDLSSGEFTNVYSLGYKDLSLESNAVDLLDDEVYGVKTYTDTVGAYMPDGISIYSANGKTYILTANEGDSREWGDEDAHTEYVNEIKEKLVATDGTEAKKIRVVDAEVVDGTPVGKNVLFGARSFSIFEVTENGLILLFDSANDFEKLTANYLPEYFNVSNDDNKADSRSQKKGPEPEAVVVGQVDGKSYAFVGLERIGGIMVYDITDTADVNFVNYINTRNFSEDPDQLGGGLSYLTGDVAPEGMYFIGADVSPSGTPILLSAFEVSGTVAAYAVGEVPEKKDAAITDNDGVEGTTTKDSENTEDKILAPKTGDKTNDILAVPLLVSGAGCLICGYLLKKKKQDLTIN